MIEHHRILKSVVSLGPISLLHTTVEAAAAFKVNMPVARNEMYRRAENMMPQLDGTYNVSDRFA